MSSSPSGSLNPDILLSLALQSPSNEALKPEQRNMRLIQLLLSAAKHTSSGNLHRADAYLHQISQQASIYGDSIQRLAARFASALASRLLKRWPGVYKALNQTQPRDPGGIWAQPIFTPAFPYMGLAYAMIAGPLVQALRREPVIHIIDLGSGDPRLWAAVLRSLAQIPDGPTHLKITCVSTEQDVLHKLGVKLVKEAQCVDVAFLFQYVPLNVDLRDLTMEMLNVMSGEALGVVSVLGLHVLLAEDDRVEASFGISKSSGVKDCKQMEEFLGMIRSTSPKILLLVEQEADHNMNRLVDRFVEGLHYYSAVFDSLDAYFRTSSSEERLILEEMLGREIENIVSCEGLERIERHERYNKWMVRLARTGFRPVNLWLGAREETKDMVEAFGQDGYKIIADRNCKMICWHQRALYSVSAWTS